MTERLKRCETYKYLFVIILISIGFNLFGQESEKQDKKRVSLKDEEDGKLDLSQWIIEANGFVPVPSIITEPALGSIGGALGVVFLKQNPGGTPNITAGLGGYTANDTWFAGFFHSHNVPEKGIKYRFGTLYSNLNISLYREIPLLGETEFKLNFRSIPVFGRFTKQIKKGPFYIGAQIFFANMQIKTQFDELPDFIDNQDFDANLASIGPVVVYDKRDNIFTPDNGFYGEAAFNISNDAILSDYNYSRLFLTLINYATVTDKWILGLRGDYQQIFNDPPFYLLPSVDLRGVPAARYQGENVALLEMENRYDFLERWSGVFFAGIAKAYNGFSDFSDSETVYNVGAGGRYLIARKFKLRMGIDIARGPEEWAWYIVFGSSWLR